MKNVILVISLSAMSLFSIAKGNDFRGHDVTMNMAFLSMSSLDFNYQGLSMLPMSVQYVYQHTGHLGYGIIANYSPDRLDFSCGQDGERVSCFSAMPTFRFTWISKRRFTLYSKASVGIGYANGIKKCFAAAQLSPVGITFGKTVFGQFELGAGTQGLPLLFGVGFRFK